MRTRRRSLASVALAALLLLAAPAAATELHGGAQLGYSGAPGGLAYFQVSEFASEFPLAMRLGLEFLAREPGNAADARRIFINNATNGVPQESGRLWGYRLDFVYSLDRAPLPNLHLFGGPRFGRFTGNFKYVGGNEDFDVTSRQWGWGLGLEGRYAVGSRSNLVLSAGFDWYGEAELRGHDTLYAPDGETVNGRENYAWNDADEAINQPGFDPRFQVGFDLRFGR